MNKEKFLTVFRLYFLETIFLTIGTLFAIFVLDETGERDDYIIYLSLFLVYFISIFLTNGSRFYRYTIFLPILGSILLHFKFFTAEELFVLNCIAVLSLFGKNWLKDNHLFIQQAFKILFHLALSGLLVLVSFGAISLILVSVQALFGLSGDKIYSYLWISAFFWFAPFLFLYFQHHERRAVHLNYLGNLLFNYIISPALIVYTAILYFYFATLLFKSELPKNIISFIVLPYLIGGFIIQFFQMLLRQNKWEKFYCHFYQLAILPIIMMWVAVYERIVNYGLTEARIYYIFCAGVMSLCYLLLWWKRTQYRWFLAIIVSGLFISTFIINVEKLAINSQLNRAKALLSQNHLLNKQGKLKTDFQKNTHQISDNDKQNLESALRYIYYNNYNNNIQENILETELGIKEYSEFSLFEPHKQDHYFYSLYYDDKKEIDVSLYQKIIFNPNYEQYEKIEIWEKEDLKSLFEQKGLDFYQFYSKEDLENKLKKELFNYQKNGRLYIISSIYLNYNIKTGYDVSDVSLQAIMY